MNIEKFKSFTEGYLKPNDYNTRLALLGKLTEGLLYEIIEELLRSKRDLIEVAKRSYLHSNGFKKILLLDCRPYFAVRLHLWPTDQLNAGAIHNHPWDMTGAIINGMYDWTIYEKVSKPGQLRFKSYSCTYNADYSGHSFELIDSISLIKTLNVSLSKGSYYDMRQNAYHKITKGNDKPADSIIICGSSSSYSADVITNDNLEVNSIICNSSYSVDDTAEALYLFLGRK